MNKEEVLARSRKENENGDEMEKQVIAGSMKWTYVVMVLAAAVFSFIRSGQGYPIMDLTATVALSVAAGHIYRFVKCRERSSLIIACVMAAVSIFSTVRFFMGH